MVREQVEYRELLLSMTRRDLLLRYKQTVMGFAWAVFMPLVNTVVFWIVFSRVAPLDTRVPYPLFAYCGLLTWNLFASALKFSAVSLTSNAVLVTKVYFPREIFPFSAVIVSLVDFAVGATVLVAMVVYYGVGAGWTVLLLPAVLLVHVAFTTAMALLLAMANLFYRDVKYVFEIVLTVWMFATPVVYPIENIGGTLGAVLALNPMTPIIEGYRAVILYGELPPAALGATAAVSLVCLGLAWITFHRAEFAFAESV